MCGICGIAIPRSADRHVDPERVVAMRDVLEHRGPDDEGIYTNGRIGLGHRRLSIVDLGGGHQPMTNEDGTVWIVFNGEIYNHRDLRPDLERRGHAYHSASDTETIVHLYEEHGVAAVERLRGMFAFAIWDAARRRLVLARDRLGVKPLYYAHASDGSLYFGSEIKSILASGAVRPELNVRALPDYLANHAPSGDETLFAGVRRLPAGHTLVWQDGVVRVDRYWDVSFARPDDERPATDREYVDEWRELFRESVRLRLMADVPLGMFLSGGIDSSAIAAVMSEMVSEPIKTFSVGFPEREANEFEHARVVARAFKTDHHEVTIHAGEFFNALPKLIWHEDEPLAHSASVPLYFVSKLAREHVKVVLTGEGSDELLGGYSRYRKTILNLALGRGYHAVTSAGMRDAVRRTVDRLASGSRIRQKLSRTCVVLEPELESAYFDNFAVFSRERLSSLLSPEAKERAGALDPYADLRRFVETTDAGTLLDRLLYADVKTYLQELLMKQDQMSMAASIESRVPFLDHRLVELTSRLPARMKLRRGWTTKYVLRRAMKGVLPDQILSRRKMGFPVPLAAWFRGPFRPILAEYVTGARALGRGLFDADAVRRIVAEHLSSERDHSERLWSLVNLEMWHRQFLDAETVDTKANESMVSAASVGERRRA